MQKFGYKCEIPLKGRGKIRGNNVRGKFVSDYDMRYKKRPDEDYWQYNWRMCRNKDLGIYPLEWAEVATIMNEELDQNYDESKYRKDYQIGSKFVEMKMREADWGKEELERLEELRIELELKKKQVQTENVYYNRIFREHSREILQVEKIAEAIEKAELDVPNFEPLMPEKFGESWLLTISDIHAYKIFESISNSYSKETLEYRMNKLLGEMMALVRKEDIAKLTILNAGDNLEGILRASSLSVLELGVIDTVVEYRRWLVQWLVELSSVVEIDYIHLISSNHTETRPLNTRAGQMPKEDLERDLANYVYDMVNSNPRAKERINVIVPTEAFHIFNLEGFNILAHHGHGIRNAEKFLTSIERKKRIFIDYMVMGHYHHESLKTIGETPTNDVEILRVPSIIGTDSYADSLGTGAKSSAVVFKFEENKGRTEEKKIILN